MGLLRSENMGLYWLKMPRESAYDIISALGRLSCMQFIDADEYDTPGFQRHFHNNIKRSEEVLIKIQEIIAEINLFDLETTKCGNYYGYLENLDQTLNKYNKSHARYFDDIEADIDKKYIYMNQLINNFSASVEQRNQFIEQRAVYQMAGKIYNSQNQMQENLGRNLLSCIAGTIDLKDQERFQRTIFRVSKGNSIAIIEEISKDQRKNQQLINGKTRQIIQKAVFIIMFAGSSSGYFRQRLLRVCDSFGANMVNLPTDLKSQQQLYIQTEKKIQEINEMVTLNENEIEKFFRHLTFVDRQIENKPNQQLGSLCSEIEFAKLYCIREKLIYQQLNLLNQTNSIYQGLVWIEESLVSMVARKLSDLSKANPNLAMGQIFNVEEYNIEPPTYIKTNDFTQSFQEIVNTYGVPRYKEANPGLLTTMTFPFLFGVMYGDIGHGSVLFIFALYLLSMTPNLAQPGPLDGLYKHRYLIFFMGLFAVFCGFIYNDFFGFQLNLFGTCYDNQLEKNETCTYLFGVDPVWGIAKNKLTFFNSLKMKLSVIIGVIQMMVGIFLKGMNSIYFGSSIDFFFEFIPQLIFLTCTFGYMCFQITLKWLYDYSSDYSLAPSILTNMMKFFLGLGATDPDFADLYQNQSQIQFYLLIAAVISVPLMLFPKPLIQSHIHGKNVNKNMHDQKAGYLQFVDEDEEDRLQKQLEQGGKQQQQKICPYRKEIEHHEFSEEFVHQMIETIEFVLGCVSHTASYLRLWALSLAHSQLAEVFFDKTLKGALVSGDTSLIVVGFVIFACITFGVLMCMDTLECFLHALRLHWVEFQSKFFKADGYKFQAFSYVQMLAEHENQ
ncbi:hypothetical protein PPERSA_12805 [Pseudocohnilembus persalinus]|uniref:V-type proton ATPase subunit a n=1 Tax=Pseudocohnilembus persalinus TaxID=266149 RepID=A0A0V0QEE5_PSEPJ|nr:hypothetical protein PPERSA_12805 [Pseudocohnilembus persalinus]|eukprot:KRX00586.1 hypothetical protein PPERSA_12805 [Pseudocohnilembus persalinus]